MEKLGLTYRTGLDWSLGSLGHWLISSDQKHDLQKKGNPFPVWEPSNTIEVLIGGIEGFLAGQIFACENSLQGRKNGSLG